jgi:glyoxylase-like metal-dependent hydrolase (beta-lactamase superfamily II)
MRIHAIRTGTVTIKSRQVEGVGRGARRRLNMLLDRAWADPLPIFAFAIEHPEGAIVVDTGETARTAERGYFPWWHPYFRFGVRLEVEREEELGPQLERLGIACADVRRVVLTHLHTDHAGGLGHVRGAEVLVSRRELRYAAGLLGRARGYPNDRWPGWFAPTAVDLPPDPLGPFPSSLRVTKAGDVTIVPLPGHTPGHVGVVVEDGDRTVLLGGDSAYSEALMLRGVVDGIAPRDAPARRTHERIRLLAASRPTVYLVAHDPETPARLAERRAVAQ